MHSMVGQSRQPRGVVVQLVRIPACHAGGRGFESRPLRQFFGRGAAGDTAASLKRSRCQSGARLVRRMCETRWGYSSAGRALAWHARGQRFDPAYLHQDTLRMSAACHGCRGADRHLRQVRHTICSTKSPSSRGLGHHPFTVTTGVRIP